MWRISAEQLFNTVNGELVSCLGRKNRASQLNQRYSDVYHSAVNFSRGWQPWRTQDDTLGQVRKIWLYGCSIFLHAFTRPQAAPLCQLIKQMRVKKKKVFFSYVRYSTLLHLCRLSIPLCRRIVGTNPGLLWLWHRQPATLTTQLDLICNLATSHPPLG